jgi:Tol biopolymer transport system component
VVLVPGTRLGAYEVLTLIGSGGMGEVYRAKDTKLGRQVALKILPATFTTDPERLARFRREAQVLASLNHPHIGAIYGLDEANGSQFLILELVEGEGLDKRIGRGALPVDEALAIAKQIAEALEAAHEKGIIHRDLKPANIALTKDGHVKVLDFGLAKALSTDVADRSMDRLPEPPTMASPAMTSMGIILGTAAYMSPEQARGTVVDKRSDIWAFGCVLYEMLTGALAFPGDTTTDIIAAILQRDPDWSRLPHDLSPRITLVLERCLQRQPKDRLRDVADVRFAIDDAGREGDGRPMPTTPVGARPPSPSRRVAPVLWLAAGVVLTAVALLSLGFRRAALPAPSVPVRAVVSLPPDTTLALDRGSAVALSPDGRRLVYSGRSKGNSRLYVRALDRFESQPLAGTDGAMHPFFSPDGQWVGFFADGKLKKMSLEGGSPVAVAVARAPRGEAWAPDGAMLLTPLNTSAVLRAPPMDGAPTPVTFLAQGELSHRWPRVLPDGKALVFSVWNDTGWESSRIAVQRLGSQEHRVIVPAGGGYPRFVSDGSPTSGYLVYARAEGLMAARFDTATLTIISQAVPVLDGLITNLSGGAHYDVSANGTLAYAPGAISESDRDLVWVTPDGSPVPLLRVQGLSRIWALSPDGTRIMRNNTSGLNKNVWIDDLALGTNMRVTNVGENFFGAWAPDGQWIAFSRGIPSPNLYRRALDGTDAEERLTTSANIQIAQSWSPDGASLAYTEIDPVSGADIWVLPLPPRGTAARVAAPRPFVKTNFTEGDPRFSRDGRWIAYDSNESGRFEVYVRAFPEGVRKWAVSTAGGFLPAWSPSGREIYYRAVSGQMMAVTVEASTDFRAGPPRTLFDARGYESTYSISPDGKRFLMMPIRAPEGAPTQIHLIFNWLDELRQRVK